MTCSSVSTRRRNDAVRTRSCHTSISAIPKLPRRPLRLLEVRLILHFD
jgi:hypothetical protein